MKWHCFDLQIQDGHHRMLCTMKIYSQVTLLPPEGYALADGWALSRVIFMAKESQVLLNTFILQYLCDILIFTVTSICITPQYFSIYLKFQYSL